MTVVSVVVSTIEAMPMLAGVDNEDSSVTMKKSSLNSFGTIFKRTSSDKVNHHGYEVVYEESLPQYRDRNITLLEIGVEDGHSMVGWSRYFKHPEARFIGVKFRATLKEKLADPRMKIVSADQSKLEDLQAVAKHGPFDIIVDDGSHAVNHQELTFETLWPHLRPGGTFFIEDIETSYWSKEAKVYGYQARGKHGGSIVNYFQQLVHKQVNMEFDSGKDKTAFRTNHVSSIRMSGWSSLQARES